MRAFLIAAFVLSLFVAVDGFACAQCKLDADGCPECLETPYDGGEYCELRDGRVVGSTICRQIGYCEGWGGSEPCGGSPCNPYQYYVYDALPEKNEGRWQLATVELIRPARRS